MMQYLENDAASNPAQISAYKAGAMYRDTNSIWAGALILLLRHEESGCKHSAQRAACLLEKISQIIGTDAETRLLCERASDRLSFDMQRSSNVRHN